MTDPNMTEFYGRVARIQKMRAKGYGFEAAGALGRSYYHRPQSRRRSFLMPILFLVLCCVLLKGVIYHSVGAESYAERVAALQAGTGVEPVGGWLMQPDPATLFVASQIEKALAPQQ
jgi:hypothetical protein